MFWERYCALCAEKNMSPTAAGLALGVKAPTVTRWRRGTTPRGVVLDKVAAFFACTTDYLLGRTDDRNPPAPPETKKAPTPEGMGDGTAMYAQVEEALIRAGFIQPGQDLSDEDLRTLSAALEIINATLSRSKE